MVSLALRIKLTLWKTRSHSVPFIDSFQPLTLHGEASALVQTISDQYVLHASDNDHSPQRQFRRHRQYGLIRLMNGELNKYSIQHVVDPSENIPTKVTFV